MNEILTCGHVYVLNETMVHASPRCGKCAACCTCVSIRQSFKAAEDALAEITKELYEACTELDKKAEAEIVKKRTKAEWQRLEQ